MNADNEPAQRPENEQSADERPERDGERRERDVADDAARLSDRAAEEVERRYDATKQADDERDRQ